MAKKKRDYYLSTELTLTRAMGTILQVLRFLVREQPHQKEYIDCSMHEISMLESRLSKTIKVGKAEVNTKQLFKDVYQLFAQQSGLKSETEIANKFCDFASAVLELEEDKIDKPEKYTRYMLEYLRRALNKRKLGT